MLEAGQQLRSRYTLQECLANHGGRQTWLALDTETSPAQRVVLKLLAFSPQLQWDELKLFEREAQVLKSLDHPQIPRYLDYFSLDKTLGQGLGWFVLVQTYIPGQSLQQYLDAGKRLTAQQIHRIAIEVLQILTVLHRLHPPVIHRDIKPSNLILGDDQRIYLVDFGAVQDSAIGEGVTFTVVGTTGYAPLEQFWGKAVPASDLYALGATLIHLATGISPADLPQKNLRLDFREYVSLKPEFIYWLEMLTHPDLEGRFSQAEQALEALEKGSITLSKIPRYLQEIGSRIKFKKTPDLLKFQLPCQGFSFSLMGRILMLLISFPFIMIIGLIILISLMILVIGFTYQSNLLMGVFFIMMPLFSLLVWAWYNTNQEVNALQENINFSLQQAFKGYQLYFDHQKFKIDHCFMGFVYCRQQGNLAEIENLLIDFTQDIVFQTRLQEYAFGKELDPAERQWILQELKDWIFLNRG